MSKERVWIHNCNKAHCLSRKRDKHLQNCAENKICLRPVQRGMIISLSPIYKTWTNASINQPVCNRKNKLPFGMLKHDSSYKLQQGHCEPSIRHWHFNISFKQEKAFKQPCLCVPCLYSFSFNKNKNLELQANVQWLTYMQLLSQESLEGPLYHLINTAAITEDQFVTVYK